MRRHTAVKTLVSCLANNDVAIFSGKDICKDAYKYDRPGNLYLNEELSPAPLALGVANGTNKRVFVFCEDSIFLRDISSLAQIAVSKCTNLFYVVLVTGIYSSTGTPTIFNEISAPKGVMFNMGFLVHNYTNLFKLPGIAKELKAIWSKARGPMTVFVDVTAHKVKGLVEVKQDLSAFREFVTDRTLGTSVYQPEYNLENMTLFGD